jgi:Nif-specific regulatory protein
VIRDFSRLVGASGPIGQLREQLGQVASTNATVLIRGESGTGKNLVAQTIHANSLRARKPFVTVHCAALPQDLLEAELFGFERGAFSGADALKKGRFEIADGGTLFLDEIGDLTAAVQVKLLRVLQAREFQRLGGNETIRIDVRVIASSSHELERARADGRLRDDFYHRLNVFGIVVPALRERKEDLPLLADHFLERFAREHGKSAGRVSAPAMDRLVSYDWPGNLRELANVIERAVVVCNGTTIQPFHLPPSLQTVEPSKTMTALSLREMVEALEKDALSNALRAARGNRSTAARLLRTTRRILNYKIQQYGIDWRWFAK